MGFRRRGRPDPEAAERLLDAVAAGGTEARQAHGGVQDPLANLLAVAAAPARPGELDGEDAAVAAFRAARDARSRADPAPTPRTTEARGALAGASARPPAGRGRLTAGAFGWVAVVVATLTAGVALAAEIPALRPAGPPRSTPSVDVGPTSVPTTAPTTTAPTTTGPTGPSTGPGSKPPTTGPGRTHPPQSLVAQCHAFLTKGRPDSGHPPTPLVRAAGGRAEVEEYCRRLLAIDPKPGRDDPNGPRDKDAPVEPPGRSPGGNGSG
ncbi:hypothetical protein GCM10022225_11700 [Plantactinospora mayteni]|uniref:Uncharacterized protein n=1 Tax=Plantactinospora mayteni TaxID=566021 RepID=A0ABQ4EH81_9ACTN|nr:hypothetical protein [Plantactinospora mayteni]GIG94078.1 hypothetical protein Pma05_06510 [Plantactinospora mayteni]